VRIALFSDSYRPVINGVAVAVDLLVAELRRRHDVTIFAPFHPRLPEPEPDVVRVPSYRLPREPDYPIAFPFTAPLHRRIVPGSFDLIHTQSPFTLGQLGRILARRHGLPLVTTFHTLYTEYLHYARPVPASWLRPGIVALTRGYCNRCDRIVVPSPPIREVLHDYGVHRPIEVIPTSAVVAPREGDAGYLRSRFAIPADLPIVMYAGRLAQEKNLELLLEAFARVRRSGARAHLFVAGGGPWEAELKGLATRLEISNAVTFAGFLDRADLIRCYAGADVFAFPSTTDTQGLVILEAKSAGLPVVSVDAYGPATVVNDGEDGFLVPNDAAAFADALGRLLADPARRREMGRRARRDAARFTPSAMADRYEEVYDAALGRAPAAALRR
jgi:glycosyltransferase involved in cell wall biosynthesis